MKKLRTKVFWTRLSIATALLILISTFSFGTFGRVAEAQMLPHPGIASMSPISGEQGKTLELTILGMHFIDGAEVSFSPSIGITVTLVEFINHMELKVTVTIAQDAPIGSKDVTVTNPDGQSDTLEGGFAVTEAKPTIDVTPPPAITGLTATDAHDGKVDLSWNPSTADDFHYYAIYVSETEITDVTGLSPITEITDIAVHTYQATGLKDDATYWFAVTAVDISGNENAMVTSVSATPTPSVVPAPRIEVPGIIVTPPQPQAGDTVTFTASIANTGTAPAADVTVNFKLDDEVVYGATVDILAGSSVTIDYSWQAEQGEHSIVVEATDASGATLATSMPYAMGVEAAGLPIVVIVVIVLVSLAAIWGLVHLSLIRRRAPVYEAFYPNPVWAWIKRIFKIPQYRPGPYVPGPPREIPQYPKSPYDPEPPAWWEEEPPPKPPPSVPHMFVPLTLEDVWAWIKRWKRRLAAFEVLGIWPTDGWDGYERRWRRQWELDILDDLERDVRDKIDNLRSEIWKLEAEVSTGKVLTPVSGTNKFKVGPENLTQDEIDSGRKKLEELEDELAKWEEALEELRKIRQEIEGRKLKPPELL